MALIQSHQQEQCHRLYYRCVVGKKAGQRWCGHVPWTGPEKEKRSPLTNVQLQPSCLPPIRNPFKAPSKTDKDSEWKKIQDGGNVKRETHREVLKDGEKDGPLKIAGEERDPKPCAESKSVEDNREKCSPSGSYEGKHLPSGMKVKKRASGEERESPLPDPKEKTGEAKDKTATKDVQQDGELHKSHTASVNSSQTDRSHHQPNNTVQATDMSAGKKPLSQEKSSSTAASHSSCNGADGATKKSPSCDNAAHLRSNQSVDYRDKPRSEEQDHKSQQNHKDKSGHATPTNRFGEQSGSDDDDVQLVSFQPGPKKTPVQKSLTSFPGFQAASQLNGQQEDPRALHNQLTAQLKQKKATLAVVNVSVLPDKGERLKSQVKDLEDALDSLSLSAGSQLESQGNDEGDVAKPVPTTSLSNPFSRHGGTQFLPAAPVPLQFQASGSSLGLELSHGYTQMHGANPQNQAFYGGRMTENRLLAVKNATCEAIDHLHGSLESCPDADTEVPDPKGIKVSLLPHQRRALAWLLWRETQNPCGGILADDMGLGKTLTMIALILAQKKKTKNDDGKEEKKVEGWISKNDSSLVVSKGTLIICPASLVHHWKREIERHIKSNKLTICLYHGPNRQRSAKVLAEHDVVVTTYSLVSKEVPVLQKDDAEKPTKDADRGSSDWGPLSRVAWARLILDEAHNIKNPKVQTSMAVCQLRATARWAVTGTPIQNNLLDMYSLLKFLHCSPFDEYKLWKSQVDNGSKRGGERLNILTRNLLLRRTKDETDSAGKPLVSLPSRTCKVHRLKLSEDEQSIYDVVLAQSKSTLQSYLKRHEGGDVKEGSSSNPFGRVAQEFGLSQSDSVPSSQQPQGSNTGIHILSLLLRLRQCCCHPSLLKKTLDQSELQGDGITLSLEEQLNALSLTSESSGPDLKDTVSLNGCHFPSHLFETAHKSSKIRAVLTELQEIRQKGDNQKSVIVSQWTSMLSIVAVHLREMGLKFAVIDGTVNPKRRMDLVEDFNTNPKGQEVMLVSLCAGGVGLNLIGGNHLFLMDMHWNPALEDQACDRIYRVGQHRDVQIHRFVCEGSVEDKISILQEKKKKLAKSILSGTGASFTKLSLADLRVIFGV
ncbi:transcription termination factor 2 [Aplochiton taeniatus]